MNIDNELSKSRAEYDQQLAKASDELFTTPIEFAVMLSKPKDESFRYFAECQKDLWPWLLRYAKLGHAAVCMAVIDREEEASK